MAKKIITTYVDDVTGDDVTGQEIHNVEMAVRGGGMNFVREFEVGEDGLKVLGEILAEVRDYGTDLGQVRDIVLGKSRKRTGAGTGGGQRGTGLSREESAEAREWAKDEGFEVSERGRLPRAVLEAWEQHKREVAA